MPNGIYLPPWLQPVDRIGPFMQGVSQGVNMARTALAAQAQQFEAQQVQQQMALRQQQEERAVATAVAGVIAQKEEQKRQQALVDMKAQQAARQFSAQMDYEQAVQSGEDPARALMRIGPRMGVNPSALAAAEMRRPQQVQPSTVVEMGGEKFIRQADEFGREKFTVIRPVAQSSTKKTPEQQAKEKNLDDLIRAKNSEIRSAAANVFGPEDKSGQILMDRLEKERESLMEQRAALYAPEEGSRRLDLIMGAEREKDRIRKELESLYDEQTKPKQETSPLEQTIKTQLEAITPKTTSTKVRRKSDGKLFTYKGSRSDIPLDKFEILE